MNQRREYALYEDVRYTCIRRDGSRRKECQAALAEHALRLSVNGMEAAELLCSPQYLTELAVGHLCTRGIIKKQEDIEEIFFNEDDTKVRLQVKSNGLCTSFGITGERAMHPVEPLEWNKAQIFAIADHFAEGTPVHKKTWAMHSCFLCQGDEILFECEDIGRHNALDKVIGHALLHDIDFTKCIIYSSGRLPEDMVRKAVTAGVPVLVSKAVPTADGVKMAEKYGLTLIGAARRDMMKVYTDFSGGNRA